MADTTSTVTNTQDENNIITTTTQLTTADPITIPEEINTNTTTTTTNNNNSNNNNNNSINNNNNNNNNELDDFELIDKPLSSSESDNNNDNNNNNNNNINNINNNNNTDGSESGDSLVHILAPEATGTEENLLTGDPIYSDKTDDVTNIDSIATSTDSYQNVFEIGDDNFMQHGENNFNLQDNSSNLTADKVEITEIIIGTEVPAVNTENTSNLNETEHETSNNIQIIPESKDNSDIPLVSELYTKDLIEITSSNNNNADSDTLDRVEQLHTNTETQDTYDDHISGTVEILEPEIFEQFPVSSVESEPPLNIPDETHDSQLNSDIPIIDTDQLTQDNLDQNMVKDTPENITEYNTDEFQQNQPITPDITTINNDVIHEAETSYQFEPVQKIDEQFDNDSDSDPDPLAANNIPPDEIYDEVAPPLPAREPNPQYSNPLEKEFWTTEDSEDTEKCYINWKKLYTRLNNKSNAVYPNMEAALDPKNRPFNRWRDILANDNTRIVLDHPQTNYINANLITLPAVQRKYIMTQGPLDCTIEHFWCMIWQQRCPGIIMLNKFREKGRVKCANYYPDDVGEQIQYGCYTIECVQTRDCRTYVYRRFVIHNTQQNESRRIVHFQYFLWPDMGVPDTPHDFLEFLLEVRSKGVLDLVGNNGPAVVHCSAGVGRSGTFILVDSCIRRLELDGHPNNIYVQNSLMQMRDQRFGCIQAPEQLRFSYIAIIVACYNIMSGKSIVEPLPNEGFPQETHSDSEGDIPIEDTIQPEPPLRTTSLFVSSVDDISMNSSDIQPMDIDPPSVQYNVEYNDVIDTTTDELRHRNVAPQVEAPLLTPPETTNEPHLATYDLTSRQYINKCVIFGVSITSFSILVALYYILF